MQFIAINYLETKKTFSGLNGEPERSTRIKEASKKVKTEEFTAKRGKKWKHPDEQSLRYDSCYLEKE